MKKSFLYLCCLTILWACNNSKTDTTTADTAASDSMAKTPVDLPYTASYSSDFNNDVSDADLKMVMVSYKDWADGNMANVAKAYSDTLEWDRPSGEHYRLPNAGIMKMWTDYRDSLSSVTIDMQGWKKMYSVDKKMAWIAAWYKEIDTYKSGKVDSGYYHDLNLVKDGKITYLEQYKRAAK
jgi:hypothetical protein